jgi:hypothetical protein
MCSGSRFTYGRACDIERGYGPPATPEELKKLASFKVQAAVMLEPLAPSIQAAAKAYPAATRVINAAPKVERRRLERLPMVLVAKMGVRRTSRPARVGTVARSRRRSRSTRRARSPSRSTDDDPSSDLTAQLEAIILERGPLSARTLALELRRRKKTVLAALHLGPFVQLGRGRAAKWDIAPAVPELERLRETVWTARCSGEIDAYEALELLLDRSPKVLAMLAAAVA